MIDGVRWECLGELGVRESSLAVNPSVLVKTATLFVICAQPQPSRAWKPLVL